VEVSLGEGDTGKYSDEERWRALRMNNPTLRERTQYEWYSGTDRVVWKDLPVPEVTLIPRDIPIPERGGNVEYVDLDEEAGLRSAGPRIPIKWQLFDCEWNGVSEESEAAVPNEIKFSQLVKFVMIPELSSELDVRMSFSWRSDLAPGSALPPGYKFTVNGITANRSSLQGVKDLGEFWPDWSCGHRASARSPVQPIPPRGPTKSTYYYYLPNPGMWPEVHESSGFPPDRQNDGLGRIESRVKTVIFDPVPFKAHESVCSYP
jgi:hypothetical protein